MEDNKKVLKQKLNSYPVIYSYIYEREGEDIKRLAGKFKSSRRKISNRQKNKVIIRFEVKDGKATPVYGVK